jgi:hypothetical protein|tara:strand:+ start:12132 stop:12314 length:183 start_codon:yes stop_codon:yes gene_type:complete
MAKGVYYKAKITKNDSTATQYWYYKTYKAMIDDVEMLYSAGIDAIELEMITKSEYENNGQ